MLFVYLFLLSFQSYQMILIILMKWWSRRGEKMDQGPFSSWGIQETPYSDPSVGYFVLRSAIILLQQIELKSNLFSVSFYCHKLPIIYLIYQGLDFCLFRNVWSNAGSYLFNSTFFQSSIKPFLTMSFDLLKKKLRPLFSLFFSLSRQNLYTDVNFQFMNRSLESAFSPWRKYFVCVGIIRPLSCTFPEMLAPKQANSFLLMSFIVDVKNGKSSSLQK